MIEVRRVPIGEIDTSSNPRFSYDSVRALAKSIERSPNQEPIEPVVVRPRGGISQNGEKYALVSGGRRLRALAELGEHLVEVVVRPMLSPELHRIEQLQANMHRRPLNAIEEAAAYEDLKDLGMSQKEIAEQLGVSEAQVCQRLKLRSLHGDVRDAVLDEELGASVAEELSRLEPDVQARVWTELRSLPANQRTVAKSKEVVAEVAKPREDPVAEGLTNAERAMEAFLQEHGQHPGRRALAQLESIHKMCSEFQAPDFSQVPDERLLLMSRSCNAIVLLMRDAFLDPIIDELEARNDRDGDGT